MDQPHAICKEFVCWNKPTVVEAGKFVHLSARVCWIEGRGITVVKKVEAVTVVELPEVQCSWDLDTGWLTVIVRGPVEIPARAHIVAKIVAETTWPKWLEEAHGTAVKIVEGTLL